MNLDLARQLASQLSDALKADTVVQPGTTLQTVLNLAKPGDVITLAPGRHVVGQLHIPNNLTLTGQVLPDRRINATDPLPILASGNAGPTIDEDWPLMNVTLRGIDFEPRQDGIGEVIALERGQNVVFDRIRIVGGANGQKRGIRGNGQGITLIGSYLANLWRQGQDSQAFAAWEGAGPYTITNNYLEASGENILFGGSDNYTLGAASNPSDISIANNHLFKPIAWRNQPGTVKNLLELKNAKNVVIKNNLLENNWTDAQAGWSIVLTPVNQDGRAPWTQVKDVLLEGNVIKGIERGINITGRDYNHVTQGMSGIVIRKNVMEVQGQALQFGGEIADLTIEDNVFENGWNIATIYIGQIREVEGQPCRDAAYAVDKFAFNRNVARHNEYGIIGGAIGTGALTGNTRSYTFLDNRFVGLRGTYPVTTQNITEADLQQAKAALLASQ